MDKNKIDEFRNLTFKFIEQYRSNQSNISRREIIEKYFEDTIELKEDIDRYVLMDEEKKEATAQMVIYIRVLGETIERITKYIAEIEEELAAINAEIKRITYESISYAVYEKQDEKQDVVCNRVEQEVKITGLQNSIEYMKEQLNVYDCSRIYDELKDMASQKAEVDEKINLLVSDSDGTKGEIEEIGHKLHLFYKNEIQKNLEMIEKKEQECNFTFNVKKEKLLQKSSNEEKLRELGKSIGQLEHAVQSYDEVEETFNEEYQCQLKRNITSINDVRHAIELLHEKLTKLEGEKQERLKIIKYVGMNEDDIDNKALILDRLARRIRELDLEKAELITENADLEKQYRHLKEGKTMELPTNIQRYFNENGIEVFYGMEWLTKNGRSAKENAALVAKNPFIPYSIIMEKDVFERFKNMNEELYTSFPIPVIIKGELEKSVENTQGHIMTYGNIHFFILFNEHLLDKEELLRMLSQLDKKMTALQKQIADKSEDIRTFGEYRLNIENQMYTTSLYARIQSEIQDQTKEREKIELRQNAIRIEKGEIAKDQKENDVRIDECNVLLGKYRDRKREFEKLSDKYVAYERDKKSLLREQNESDDLKKKQKELESCVEELTDEMEGLKALLRKYKASRADLEKKASVYETFADRGQDIEAIMESKEANQLEARYQALTQKVSEAMDDLEVRQRKNCCNRRSYSGFSEDGESRT